jgi:Family of unknown function (DUF6152)
MRNRLGILVLIALAGLVPLVLHAPLFAHHGAAAFSTDVITMKATVTDFRFINPHVQVYFTVKNEKGEAESWRGELTAPNKLARAGWTKSTLQPAEECEISGRPNKNGAHILWISKILKANGEFLKLSETIE